MNNSTFIHKYFRSLINSEDTTADMTMGNGNDTFYLSKLSRKVYAFDIQEEALINTRKRCQDLNNIVYIKDNHLNFDKYIKEEVKLYDYIESGSKIGTSLTNEYYYVLLKDNKPVNINEN